MIYEVYLNDNLLYYPNDSSYVVMNAKLETALNEAGSFECDIPQNNLRYIDFDDGAQLRSGVITVLKDGTEIFCGEVRECTQNFDFTRHIYVVGELAYLFDSIQPQKVYQGTVSAMFGSLLTYHNSQVESRKKFTKGNVTVTDANNYIYHFTNREDTLTAIREKLCNTLDGYIKIRKVNGTKYLDFVPLSSYGRYCQQEIQFGENLLDYSQNYTANDIATAVIPLGARLDDDKRTSAAVKGLDEYLTIVGTSADPSSTSGARHANVNDDYMYIQNAVSRYGYVRVVQHWDDVTVKNNLKAKAKKWLESAQYAQMELELSAVDLSLINNDIESFEVGDTIHCWAEPYGMDTTFPVRKKTIYLNDLSKNTIVLGNTETAKSYTKQASDAVNLVKESIPQLSPVLEQSRQTALTMLLSETQGGYVVYEYHYNASGEADYIEAINICNNKTIDSSTARWRWSYNGLGFLERANTSAPWPSSSIPIAITNDGKINADRILAGTIDADIVRVHGKIEATDGYFESGYFGTGKKWILTENGIHSKDGPTASYGQSKKGTYVGADGFCCNGSNTHVWISDGAITSNGTILAKNVTGENGFTTGGQTGKTTGAFSFTAYVNGVQKAVGLNFKNGILVGISGF